MQTHHVTWLFLIIIGFGSIKVVVSIMLLLLYILSFLLSIFHWIGVDLLCNLHYFLNIIFYYFHSMEILDDISLFFFNVMCHIFVF
jgi:hypothetical protein